MKQVEKKHYTFEYYMSPERWASFYYQIREIQKLQPKSVLEIGGGDGTLRKIIEHTSSIVYTSLDSAEDLQPDILGSVLEMPCREDTFDIVAAFEVLEHLPFDDFKKALLEMKRVSRRYVLLSLPDSRPHVRAQFKIPFLPKIQFAWKLSFPRTHHFDGQHYWEIGKRGYGASAIRSVFEKHFHIRKDFIPYENQYHHFYVLEKK